MMGDGCDPGVREATADANACGEVEAVLREQIELARPDDLAFLESQVPYIARRIVARLRSRDGR